MLANTRGGQSTVIEGSGRFVGEPPTGAIGRPSEDVTDGVDDTRDAGEQIGSGLQVVQLKYVAASEIRRVLETIAPRGGIVRTDDSRHLITLSGNDREGPMAG